MLFFPPGFQNQALVDKIKMDRPNQIQMKNTHPLYIVFEVLKVHLIMICEMQSLDLLFLVVMLDFLSGDIIFH